jgi:phosphomannomutase
MNDSIVFGTDGWRGVMDETFTEENVLRVANAFLRYAVSLSSFSNHPLIAVGYDGRTNSHHYAELFSNRLAHEGCRVLLSSGVIPTPVLSYSTKKLQCLAGVMITASHNPPRYNGLKFKAAYGGPFMSEETNKIEQQLSAGGISVAASPGGKVEEVDFLPAYISHLKTMVDTASLQVYASKNDRRAGVIIDSMGGAGQTILEDFLVQCGWRAQTIFGEVEPQFFGRVPEPIAQNLSPLMYNVRATDAQIGLATDGDADRCSVVYDDGEWVNAQETILALLWHLRVNKDWRGAIVKTASVTDKVRLFSKDWNESLFDVHVGFKYITEVMLQQKCMFGGEESGGFGFGPHIPERDGILANLLFVEMLAKTELSLHSIIAKIRTEKGQLYYDRVDATYTQPDRNILLPQIIEKKIRNLAGFDLVSITRYEEMGMLTGLKLIFGDCRWSLIRTSQTEPLIRLYAEGQSKDEVTAFLEETRKLLGL